MHAYVIIDPFLVFQLTPAAEGKVVKARELLDTIVKENRGWVTSIRF